MRISKGVAASLAVTAGALAVVSPAVAKPTTRTVSPGQSIQAAIDKSKPGDKVVVKHGTYHESLQIGKNRIKLVGEKATLTQPVTPASTVCNQHSGPPIVTVGICVIGDVTFAMDGTPTVNKQVQGVKISGFTITKFTGDGVFILGGKKTVLKKSNLVKNGGYGAFSNTSSGTQFLNNVSKGNGDAGFYVGDSPKANATVAHNTSIGNSHEGIFLRNASHGTVVGNVVSGNCAGILVLADAPGPAGHWKIQNNDVPKNNKACPATTGEPPLSGLGIGLSGANDTQVLNNKVVNNTDKHPSLASGGIVVLKGTGGTLPANDLVKKNTLSKNSPFDIKWDSTGTVTFKNNTCSKSSPSGLC